jgi:hypothetical protein
MELVEVYNTPNPWRAEFIKSLLETEEIESVLSGIDPFAPSSSHTRHIQVMVRVEVAEQAREVLEESGFGSRDEGVLGHSEE